MSATEKLILEAVAGKKRYWLKNRHTGGWTTVQHHAQAMPREILEAWVNDAQFALPKGTTQLIGVRYEFVNKVHKNPRRVRHPRTIGRDKVKRPRVHISGRFMRSRFTASRKTRITGDPRKLKRALRKTGYRVNPLPAALKVLKGLEAVAYRKNPKRENNAPVLLQERRGNAWHLLCTMKNGNDAACIKVAEKYQKRHPRKKLRLIRGRA